MNHLDDPIASVFTDVGEAEFTEPEWIIKNLLPTGLTFLAGPPKSYKSTVELALLLGACGVESNVLPADLAEAVRPGIVMGLSLEAMAGVLRHTAREGFGVEIPADGRFLVVDDPWRFRLDQPDDVRELLGWAERIQPRVLFVDPLRNCHALDENDSGGMVMMLQPLQQWAVKTNTALIVVHHSRKLGGDGKEQRTAKADDMRGSSALFGMADATLTVTAKNTQGLIHVDAVFKRAEAWQRTIQLGIWGHRAMESIDSLTKSVFEAIVEGKSPQDVASSLHIGKAKVSECVTILKRIGALTQSGTPTSTGSTIVTSAVRKFVSNGSP